MKFTAHIKAPLNKGKNGGLLSYQQHFLPLKISFPKDNYQGDCTHGNKPMFSKDEIEETLPHQASLSSGKRILTRDLGRTLTIAWISNQDPECDLGLQFQSLLLFSGSRDEK